MKKKYGYCVIAVISAYVVSVLGQEFTKPLKTKKVYVTYQQYLELEGDLTVSANTFWGLCSDLLQSAFLVQKGSLGTINMHIDGEKDCFLQQVGKVERTDKYTKLMKIKQEIDRCIDELRAMKQRLEILIADFYV